MGFKKAKQIQSCFHLVILNKINIIDIASKFIHLALEKTSKAVNFNFKSYILSSWQNIHNNINVKD